MRGWQEWLKPDEMKVEPLRVSIKAGVEALDRGQYEDVEDEDLDTISMASPRLRRVDPKWGAIGFQNRPRPISFQIKPDSWRRPCLVRHSQCSVSALGGR